MKFVRIRIWTLCLLELKNLSRTKFVVLLEKPRISGCSQQGNELVRTHIGIEVILARLDLILGLSIVLKYSCCLLCLAGFLSTPSFTTF